MNIKNIGIIVEKFIRKNGPTLLMSAGLISFGGAIYATGKATVKSVRDVDAMEETPSTGEIVKAEWKNYIPAAILTVTGAGCVIGANHMQLVRIETIAAAYALNRKELDKYKGKVKELLGDKKASEIEDKIAQDRTDNLPPWEGQNRMPTKIGPNGQQLFRCIETLTGQTFWSNSIDIDQKVNEFNNWLIKDGTCTVNEWLDILGCEQVDKTLGDLVWDCNAGHGDLLTITKHSTIRDDEPVLVISYGTDPKPSFLD